MTRISKGQHTAIDSLGDAAAASMSDLLRADQGGLNELKMTLSQVATLFRDNLETLMVTTHSAASFTTTGQTSAAFGAVTSNANSFGMASKGQMEGLLTLAIDNKRRLDAIT